MKRLRWPANCCDNSDPWLSQSCLHWSSHRDNASLRTTDVASVIELAKKNYQVSLKSESSCDLCEFPPWRVIVLLLLSNFCTLAHYMHDTRLPLYMSTRIGKLFFFLRVSFIFLLLTIFLATPNLRLLFPSNTITTSTNVTTFFTNIRNNEERLEMCHADTSQAPGMFSFSFLLLIIYI